MSTEIHPFTAAFNYKFIAIMTNCIEYITHIHRNKVKNDQTHTHKKVPFSVVDKYR